MKYVMIMLFLLSSTAQAEEGPRFEDTLPVDEVVQRPVVIMQPPKPEPIKHHQEWFCTEEASQRTGNVISACGVGASKFQFKARANALEHAKAEFISVCNSSSDCINHEFFAEPKRLTCERIGGIYVCYRLIVFTIGEPIKPQKLIGTMERLFGSN